MRPVPLTDLCDCQQLWEVGVENDIRIDRILNNSQKSPLRQRFQPYILGRSSSSWVTGPLLILRRRRRTAGLWPRDGLNSTASLSYVSSKSSWSSKRVWISCSKLTTTCGSTAPSTGRATTVGGSGIGRTRKKPTSMGQDVPTARRKMKEDVFPA